VSEILLAIDVGNTNTVFAAFDGPTLLADWRLSTQSHRTADEWAVQLLGLCTQRGLASREIGAVVLASVVPDLTPAMVDLAARYLGHDALVVSHEIDTGVAIRYDRPGEVGADRLCDAVAARALYGAPAVVIDFGTATTFNAISAAGDYLGGAIAPGIGIAVDALFEHAARLAHVELRRPPRAIGANTEHALQSGIILGYAGMVEAMTRHFKRELGGHACVIATGGLAPLMAGQTAAIDVVDPLLTLHGLRLIYARHRGGAGDAQHAP
jgi:type III pantothenate kinase